MCIDRLANTARMTSCHSAPMDKKAGPGQQPTLGAGDRDGVYSQDGFTLLEIVCAVAIVAMLAAVLLPRMPVGTSRPRLEAYAIGTAALLSTDRTAAMRRRVQVSTEVDARARSVRSGANGRTLRIPDDVVFDAILPRLCNGRPAFSTIGFLPTGMSCGGSIVLTRLGVGYEINVNWLTGGVEVVSRHAL
jgi:general secretion pathway protein H